MANTHFSNKGVNLQYDQMASLFFIFGYLQEWKFAQQHKKLPKYVQTFAHKVAKFRSLQIWFLSCYCWSAYLGILSILRGHRMSLLEILLCLKNSTNSFQRFGNFYIASLWKTLHHFIRTWLHTSPTSSSVKDVSLKPPASLPRLFSMFLTVGSQNISHSERPTNSVP